ncbi:hypothetical protein Efla_003010 [Eimeria flavescens]
MISTSESWNGRSRRSLAAEGAHFISPLIQEQAPEDVVQSGVVGRRRSRFLRVPFTLTAAALLLTIIGGVAAARQSDMVVHPEGMDEEAKALRTELELRAGEFGRLWEAASPRVQKGYIENYMPSFENDKVGKNEVVGLYMKHVNGVSGLPVPSKEKTERKQYEQLMKLMTSLMTVACKRLKGLQEFEQFHEENEAEVPLLHLEDPHPLPSEVSEEVDGGVPFGDFLSMTRGPFPSNMKLAYNKYLPYNIVEKLLNAVDLEDRLRFMDLQMIYHIEDEFVSLYNANVQKLIKPYLWRMHPIPLPYDNTSFDPSFFVRYLHERYLHASHKFLDGQLMEDFAANWTVKGIKSVFDKVMMYHRERPEGRLDYQRFTLSRLFRTPESHPSDPRLHQQQQRRRLEDLCGSRNRGYKTRHLQGDSDFSVLLQPSQLLPFLLQLQQQQQQRRR